MVKRIVTALIVSLVVFLPFEVIAQTEGTKSPEPKVSQNTYDIPDDILKNIEKKSPGQPVQKEVSPSNKAGGGNKKNTPAATTKNNAGKVVNNQGKKKNEIEEPPTDTKNLKPGVHKFQGFRIQVFSDGRNQATLQSRAKARGTAIVAKFPKYRGQVYSFSKSPNWYTQVGNFLTQKEADKALAELKKAFPNLANEMRVVKSFVTIIKK